LKALKYINKFFIKYKWRLLIGILITILSKLLALKVPQIVGDSLNIVEDYQSGVVTDYDAVKHQLFINVLIIIGVALLAGFFKTSIIYKCFNNYWCSTFSWFFYFFNEANYYCNLSVNRIRFKERNLSTVPKIVFKLLQKK